MKNLLITLFLAAALGVASPAQAGPGTAKKATGIVLISVGSAVGGALLLVGALDAMVGCNPEYDRACAADRRFQQQALLGGGALLAGSIIGGIALIRAGREEQRIQLGLGTTRAAVVDAGRRASPLPALRLRMDL